MILFLMSPSLSVIMPNYNHADYLPTALNAILSQSRKAEEIVIVDDASTDRSVSVIQEFAKQHPEIRLCRQMQNQGPNAAVNLAVGLAKGDYLAFCSADDRILPSFFEIGLSFAEKHPKLGLFCSKLCFFDTDTPDLLEDEKTWLNFKDPKEFSPEEALHLFRATNFRISTPASIYKRSSVLKMGGYRLGTKMVADWLLNCQIALHEGFIYVPRPLASLRKPTKAPSYSSRLYGNKNGREAVYGDVLKFIKESDDKKIYKKSLIIYQLGLDMLIYLLKRPRHWGYLPAIFWKKITSLCKAS